MIFFLRVTDNLWFHRLPPVTAEKNRSFTANYIYRRKKTHRLPPKYFPLDFFFAIYSRKNDRLFFVIVIKNTAQYYFFTVRRQKALSATYFLLFIPVFMVMKYCTKILILPKIFSTKFCFTFYGNKILYKNLPRFSDGRKCALLAKS